MDVNLLLSLIGITLAIVSAVIAYLQLRYQVLDIKGKGSSAIIERAVLDLPLPAGFSLFAPTARIEGIAANFINRSAHLGLLRKCLLQHKSLVVVEGVIGVGKTSLIARYCQDRLLRWMGYKSGWVFCAERPLTLKSLAKSIVLAFSLPKDSELRQIVMTDVASAQLSDSLIQHLSRNKFILVLDDYHLVSDKEVHDFIRNVAKSKLSSMLILTSDVHLDLIEKLPTIEIIRLNGFRVEDAMEFLKTQGVDAEKQILHQIWQKAGNGVPEAMRILVGLSKTRSMFELLRDEFPAYTKDLEMWLSQLVNTLSPSELEVLKFIAFTNEPVPIDLLRRAFPSDEVISQAIDGLFDKFLLTRSSSYISVHPLVQGYVFKLLSEEERNRFSIVVTDYSAGRARDLLLGVKEEPSYGKIYLEAHPEYIQDEARHIRFVDSLLERLRENGFVLSPGSRILVLGAGHGIHDAAFAKHGFQILNVELIDEVVEIGRERAKNLGVPITYLIADMIKDLDIEPNSMDAVFNIGSSFGFEEDDTKNAMVFKNAARALRDGQPFVFEYANGTYWSRSVERDVEAKELPNGSIRTKYKILNPIRSTCLDVITLQRPDGSRAHFHHFMHYYSLSEVTNMMSRAGLRVIAVYGGPDGEPFDPDGSRSMVIVATKNKE